MLAQVDLDSRWSWRFLKIKKKKKALGKMSWKAEKLEKSREKSSGNLLACLIFF